jgi:hypothetical protein
MQSIPRTGGEILDLSSGMIERLQQGPAILQAIGCEVGQ